MNTKNERLLTPMKRTRRLTEGAILLAIATVLSLLKLADLPYGGSITLASMLPLVILAYRHGTVFGIATGLVYGVIQQLLGLSTLSYVSTWQSILAVILLDYVVAFAVIGLAGLFRRLPLSQSTAVVLGCLTAGIARYLCHVLSGATVWAGLSIPDSAALLYSLIYNATYMLPETVVLALAGYYLSSALDLSKAVPVRIRSEKGARNSAVGGSLLRLIGRLGFVAALIYDVVEIFSNLQDPESGEFLITGIQNANFPAIAVVSVLGIALWLICTLLSRKKVQQKAA